VVAQAPADLDRAAIATGTAGEEQMGVLWPAGPAIAAEEFAGTLTGEGWCEARVEPRARWDTLSPAGDGSVQVSVVTAGFGDQTHAYAFFADPRGKGFAEVASPEGSPSLSEPAVPWELYHVLRFPTTTGKEDR
jgi:hypothetical protein